MTFLLWIFSYSKKSSQDDIWLELHISWFFNFLSGNGKIDQFPGREKPGKPGKFCTVTKISKFWAQFGKITKPDQIGQIFLILQMVKALDGIQMLIHSKRSNFGQF